VTGFLSGTAIIPDKAEVLQTLNNQELTKLLAASIATIDRPRCDL
jgi:hypothetical protein